MKTKICTKCGIEKPITEFHWRNKAQGTLRSECKECHINYMQAQYQRKKNAVEQIKQKLSCAKCGYNEYSVALDFHHLNKEEKEETISRMVSNKYKIDKTLEEIDKCIRLCSNCHRVFHYLEKEQNLTIEQFLFN